MTNNNDQQQWSTMINNQNEALLPKANCPAKMFNSELIKADSGYALKNGG